MKEVRARTWRVAGQANSRCPFHNQPAHPGPKAALGGQAAGQVLGDARTSMSDQLGPAFESPVAEKYAGSEKNRLKRSLKTSTSSRPILRLSGVEAEGSAAEPQPRGTKSAGHGTPSLLHQRQRRSGRAAFFFFTNAFQGARFRGRDHTDAERQVRTRQTNTARYYRLRSLKTAEDRVAAATPPAGRRPTTKVVQGRRRQTRRPVWARMGAPVQIVEFFGPSSARFLPRGWCRRFKSRSRTSYRAKVRPGHSATSRAVPTKLAEAGRSGPRRANSPQGSVWQIARQRNVFSQSAGPLESPPFAGKKLRRSEIGRDVAEVQSRPSARSSSKERGQQGRGSTPNGPRHRPHSGPTADFFINSDDLRRHAVRELRVGDRRGAEEKHK